MGHTLEGFAAACHRMLTEHPGRAGREEVCALLKDVLRDDTFVTTHLKERAAGANPREVLYEDPDLGFCICGHVYGSKANGFPHDHGPSWAIYGQATGVTEMTDWKIVEKGSGGKPTLVEPVRTYEMKPGDATS